METARPSFRHLSVSVKFDTVLFPFDPMQFEKALPKYGFILTEESHPTPLGIRREVTGYLAGKGEVFVRLDTPRMLLAVHASDLGSVATEMELLELLLKEEFDLDCGSLAQYFEFLAGISIEARKNPLEIWHSHLNQAPILKKVSDIIGTEASPYGFRFAPKGEGPNQANWFDVDLQPLITSPTTHHRMQVVFRRSLRDEVFSFIRKFDDLMVALLAVIEEE